MTRRIPQTEPVLGEEEQQALIDVVSSGWFVEGARTRELEQAFAAQVGTTHAIAVATGTGGLHIALKALGVGRDDEVLVPDLTFVASANAVELCGGIPVFVDIDPRTQCLDVEQARAAIGPRTRAIMVVHLNGRCPDMRALRAVADAAGLPLIEDACQALGSFHQGVHLGAWSSVAVFSFSTPKIITTGQGGMVVTNDPKINQTCRRLKDFGRDSEKKHDAAIAYDHVTIGYNYKVTEFQSAIGLIQLKDLPARLARRKAQYAAYRAALADVPEIRFLGLDDGISPCFTDIHLPSREVRRELVQYLGSQGVETRMFYPPLHKLTFFPPASSGGRAFPVTDQASACGLNLPSSARLTDDDLRLVCEKLRTFFKRA